MATNANVSDGTLPIHRKEKTVVEERSAPKVIEKPEIIGDIKESKDLKSLGILRNLMFIGSLRYLT